MSYLDAFRARSRQNPPPDKTDETAKIEPEPRSGHFGENVNFGRGRKSSAVVSPAGTPWRSLMDYERAARMAERGLTGEWLDAAGIWSRSPPACLSAFPGYWKTLQADSEQLLAALPSGDCWAARLQRIGWTLLDVWGVHEPEHRRHKGLVLCLGGSTLLAATGDTFTVRGRSGELLIFRHADSVARVPLWRLEA